MKKSEEYKKHFQKSQSLGDLLAYFSVLTWEKYTKVKNYPTILSTNEVCINELFVETIVEAILDYNVPIRLFHSKDETANGNDFEMILPFNKYQYLLFPCQAKRMYVKNDKYDAISHLVKPKTSNIKREQILSLLEYAEEKKGFPLYFFYNYTPNNFQHQKIEEYSDISDKELFGCTMLSAFHIFDNFFTENKRLKRMSFGDIHPPAMPLFKLANLYNNDFISNDKILSVFGKFDSQEHDEELSNMDAYDLDTLSKMDIIDRKWIEIYPTDKTRYTVIDTSPITNKEIILTKNENVFNPKYRIIFTPEIINSKDRLTQ
jgi:hypothetical protein